MVISPDHHGTHLKVAHANLEARFVMQCSPDHHRFHLQVAHANMEARIEQSLAYVEVQEQLKQASLDSTAQQALTEEMTSLTSQILSRSVH